MPCEEENQHYFEETEEVNSFWKGLWETEAKDNMDATWIKEVEESMGAEVGEEEITRRVGVSVEQVKSAIGKKRNWSRAGRDKIRKYWWKKFTVVHEQIAEAYENILNDAREIDIEWLVMGKTELIPKEGDWSAANQRPITLLNTCYKWLTTVLKEKMEKHLVKFDMLQCDQRGGRRSSWGVVDNLLIDGMILEECRMSNKNLNCTWVDVAKAYDSVSHKWLFKTLELHKIPTAIANTIIKLSKQWKTRLRVKTQAGLVLTESIQFKQGVYRGNTLCPLLFIMCVNPMSWNLRTLPGYRLTKPLNINISHGLFIDDLKLYSSSERQHGIKLALSHQMMEDMGQSLAAKKTQNHLNDKRETCGERCRIETIRRCHD